MRNYTIYRASEKVSMIESTSVSETAFACKHDKLLNGGM